MTLTTLTFVLGSAAVCALTMITGTIAIITVPIITLVFIGAALASAKITVTATAKITMLGCSHRRAGACGTGVVGMPVAGLANAVNLVVTAMGASVTVADLGCTAMVIARRFRVRECFGHGRCVSITINAIHWR